MNSLFCRHNRFTADCPICSKGTVLDSSGAAAAKPRRPRASGGGGRARSSEPAKGARRYTGPYVSAGPYEQETALVGTGALVVDLAADGSLWSMPVRLPRPDADQQALHLDAEASARIAQAFGPS